MQHILCYIRLINERNVCEVWLREKILIEEMNLALAGRLKQ